MHFKVAYVEVSPNFAGTIMGIVNGIANAMGIVVPMVVALMVDGNVSQQIYVATIIRLKFKNHFF